MQIAIPKFLQDRFDSKRVEYESEQARLDAEAKAKRDEEIKAEDRQRQLVADTVNDKKLSAKDADFLAEKYSSDLEFSRDAESYLRLRDAVAANENAEHHDDIVQACQSRVVEIDELIGSYKIELKTRIGDRSEVIISEGLKQRDEAKTKLSGHIAADNIDFELIANLIDVESRFNSLAAERSFLANKARSHEVRRDRIIDARTEIIGNRDPSAEPKPLFDADSLLAAPLNFTLSSSLNRQPLPAIVPKPSPIKERNRQRQAIRESKQSVLTSEQDRRDLAKNISRLEELLGIGKLSADQSQETRARLQTLKAEQLEMQQHEGVAA